MLWGTVLTGAVSAFPIFIGSFLETTLAVSVRRRLTAVRFGIGNDAPLY